MMEGCGSITVRKQLLAETKYDNNKKKNNERQTNNRVFMCVFDRRGSSIIVLDFPNKI